MLGPVVEDVALSPSVIRRIVEGDVNDSWVKALKEADRKMKAIEALDSRKVKAAQDVKPELERLTHKVSFSFLFFSPGFPYSWVRYLTGYRLLSESVISS